MSSRGAGTVMAFSERTTWAAPFGFPAKPKPRGSLNQKTQPSLECSFDFPVGNTSLKIGAHPKYGVPFGFSSNNHEKGTLRQDHPTWGFVSTNHF